MRTSLKWGKGIPIRDENKHVNDPARKKRLIFGSTPVSSNDGMIGHFCPNL